MQLNRNLFLNAILILLSVPEGDDSFWNSLVVRFWVLNPGIRLQIPAPNYEVWRTADTIGSAVSVGEIIPLALACEPKCRLSIFLS
jgi:hypothetical protein